jgi:hypothetical protein
MLLRTLTAVALSLTVAACDDIILPPDPGNGGNGGGNGGDDTTIVIDTNDYNDTTVVFGLVQGVVSYDSGVDVSELNNARVALLWHRKDGTRRVGSVVPLDGSTYFKFGVLHALDPEDLLVDPTSSVTNTPYGIASIALITNPSIEEGFIWNPNVTDSRDFMYLSETHDVIYRASADGAVQGADMWLSPFPVGYALGLKNLGAPIPYAPDLGGVAVIRYTK